VAGVEAASERAKGRKDKLVRGGDEAAARNVTTSQRYAKFGVEVARKLGPRLAGLGLMAQHHAVDLSFVDQPPAAMLDDRAARVVIARHPGPVGRRSQPPQRRPRVIRQAFAPGRIVETVA
jgi:hypothetical protein